MFKIITAIQSFHQNAIHFIFCFQDGIFRCKRMNADNIWILSDELNNRVILFYLLFFCDGTFQWLLILHTYMSPKTEDLLTHRFLEPISECKSDDHDSDADRCCHNGKANNEP